MDEIAKRNLFNGCFSFFLNIFVKNQHPLIFLKKSNAKTGREEEENLFLHTNECYKSKFMRDPGEEVNHMLSEATIIEVHEKSSLFFGAK